MPKSTRGEIAVLLAKIGLSFIPVAGGAASEIFGAIVAPQLEKRRTEWFEGMANDLEQLKGKIENLTPESLSQNDSFVTMFLHASRTAISNHQREKLEALRNAVLNAATPNAPDDDLQLMFLDAIDTLTTWHLRVLAYFDNPRQWFTERGLQLSADLGSALALLQRAYPELDGRVDFCDILYNELSSRGLLDGPATSIHGSMTASGTLASRTTQIGKQFIRYITSPLDKSAS
jgi:hypothetical protein